MRYWIFCFFFNLRDNLPARSLLFKRTRLYVSFLKFLLMKKQYNRSFNRVCVFPACMCILVFYIFFFSKDSDQYFVESNFTLLRDILQHAWACELLTIFLAVYICIYMYVYIYVCLHITSCFRIVVFRGLEI